MKVSDFVLYAKDCPAHNEGQCLIQNSHTGTYGSCVQLLWSVWFTPKRFF